VLRAEGLTPRERLVLVVLHSMAHEGVAYARRHHIAQLAGLPSEQAVTSATNKLRDYGLLTKRHYTCFWDVPQGCDVWDGTAYRLAVTV